MTQLTSRYRLELLALTVSALATAFTFADEAFTAPRGMILTWQGDPSTTMTIDWHRMPDQAETPALIQARPRGTQEWRDFPAERFPFPHSDRLIDRIEITGLKPATEYEFRGCPASKVYWFRTMPKTLVKPLVIAAGGDVRHRKSWMDQSNRAVMAHNPDFVVWGGDFAYADGRPDQINRWYEFLDSMVTTLVTKDSRVPPVLGCIGNHELPGGYHKGRIKSEADRAELAPYFYSLLAFPGQPGYGVVDFGNYLSLVFGDSEHTNPIPGKQTDWMRETLAARKNVPHLIPVYHCAAWPSARPFENEVSKIIRDEWVPLFEQNGVRLALEHHDHTYKRTVPIFEGKENTEKGVIYIGDGSWGVDTKKAHDVDKTWYLERAQSIRHALIIKLHSDRQEVTAITPDGKEIETITIPAR